MIILIRTFFNFSMAAFSFFSHFLADRCIVLETIRILIISSSRDTLLPIFGIDWLFVCLFVFGYIVTHCMLLFVMEGKMDGWWNWMWQFYLTVFVVLWSSNIQHASSIVLFSWCCLFSSPVISSRLGWVNTTNKQLTSQDFSTVLHSPAFLVGVWVFKFFKAANMKC